MILEKDIVKVPHPTLRAIAEEVKVPVDIDTKNKLKEMMEYLKASQNEELCAKYGLNPGVGLAANQLDIKKRMLVLYVDSEEDPIEYAIINPVVLSKSIGMCYLDSGEGCLSVPGGRGKVLRHKKIKFKALVLNNDTDEFEERRITLQGYHAIIFQHEFDHLNGVLFTDKVTENVGNALSI